MGFRSIFCNKQIWFHFTLVTCLSFALAVCEENKPEHNRANSVAQAAYKIPPKRSPIPKVAKTKPSNSEKRNMTTAETKTKENNNGKVRREEITYGDSYEKETAESFSSPTIIPTTKVIVDPTKYIASLRIFPSELHLCSASFISYDVLLTSANCIYGRDTAKAYVRALSSLMEMDGVWSPVKIFHTHPEFEPLPSINNVGIIKLWEPINEVIPLLLPPPLLVDHSLNDVFVHGWQFSKNGKYFQLLGVAGEHISNTKCSIILKEKLDCSRTVCAANSFIIHGSYDEGLPFIHTEDGTNFIIGIYNRQGITPHVKVDKYEKVAAHLEWITKFLSHQQNV